MGQHRERWTAEDYDQVERLIDLGLPAYEIAQLIDRDTTADALRAAMRSAGIAMARPAGRPTSADRERWKATRLELLGLHHDAERAARRADVDARARITLVARRLGYDVTITKREKS